MSAPGNTATTGVTSGSGIRPFTTGTWRNAVQTLYPDLLSRTYCVPPVYFNRVDYTRDTVAGEPVLVTPTSTTASAPPSAPRTSSEEIEKSVLPAIDLFLSAIAEHLSTDKSESPSQQQSQAASRSSDSAVPVSDLSATDSCQSTSTAHEQSLPHKSVQRSSAAFSKSQSSEQNQADSKPSSQAASQDTESQHHSPPPAKSQKVPLPESTYSLYTRDPDPSSPPANVQETDTRDDFAQQHVLQCLRELGQDQQETMFVLSQLEYGNYLNKPSYAAAAALLPKPVDVLKHLDGDLDVLIVHRRYGVLIGELKSVGLKDVKSKTEPNDNDVAKRVRKGIAQLDRSETVIRHLTGDITPSLQVRKSLMLPYVRMAQLQRVLANDKNLEHNVCRSLGAPDGASAAELCLCADQMSDPASPWHVTPAMPELSAWWNRRMTCTTDPAMSDDVYLDIVSRLVGPATSVSVHCVVPPRVEVRTEGEAVSEVGERMARVVLTPRQVGLVSRPQRMVCLTGPPGTGKTLLLVLKGLRWLRRGHDVHVVSIGLNELAVSFMICHQLNVTLRHDPTALANAGRVRFHQFNFHLEETDVDAAVNSLAAHAENGHLYVLIDEAPFSYDRLCPRVTELIRKLNAKVSQLNLWAASLFHFNMPDCLKEEEMTLPLRCPPIVHREVEQCINALYRFGFHVYTGCHVSPPSDGPPITHVRHLGQGHTTAWPIECESCGEEVGRVLTELQVGKPPSSASRTAMSPPPLQNRDVLVLTFSKDLRDDTTDHQGRVVSPACGFVRGLRRSGFPVCVLNRHSPDIRALDRDVKDLAVAQSDRITITDFETAKGLERKIVVRLPGKPMADNYIGTFYNLIPDAFDRIRIMSRCVSQLILVDRPPREVEEEELD